MNTCKGITVYSTYISTGSRVTEKVEHNKCVCAACKNVSCSLVTHKGCDQLIRICMYKAMF